MSEDVRLGVGPMTDAVLDNWYAVPPGRADGRRWVRAGMISSLDGRATGPDGTSASLNAGSAADHAAFTALRRWADVVVVGAGTVRAESYPPLPEAPLVVVSRTPGLPPSLQGSDPGRVVLVHGDGDDVPPQQVLEEIGSRGWSRVLLEGGPALLGSWLEAGVVDELCVTVRPVLAGGAGPLVIPEGTDLGGLLGRPTHVISWGGDCLLRVALAAGRPRAAG